MIGITKYWHHLNKVRLMIMHDHHHPDYDADDDHEYHGADDDHDNFP